MLKKMIHHCNDHAPFPCDHLPGLYSDAMEGDLLCTLTDSQCLSLGESSLLTPIDRLCSMQDSYFTS